MFWNVNRPPSQQIRAVACTSGPICGRLNWSQNEVRLKYHAVALSRAAPEGTGYLPYDFLKTTGDHSGQQLCFFLSRSLGFTGRNLGWEDYRFTWISIKGRDRAIELYQFTAPWQLGKNQLSSRSLMPLASSTGKTHKHLQWGFLFKQVKHQIVNACQCQDRFR